MKRTLYFSIILALLGTVSCNDDSGNSGKSCSDAKPADDCTCDNGSWNCPNLCEGTKPANDCTCNKGSWNCPGQCEGTKPEDDCTCENGLWNCPNQCAGEKPHDDCTCNSGTWNCPSQCETVKPEEDCTCNNGIWNCPSQCDGEKTGDDCDCEDGTWNCSPDRACGVYSCNDVLSGYTCDKEKRECNCNGVSCYDFDLPNPICTKDGCKSAYVTMKVVSNSDDFVFIEDESDEIVYLVTFDRAPEEQVTVTASATLYSDGISCTTDNGTNTGILDENNWNTGIEFHCKVTDWDKLRENGFTDYIDYSTTAISFITTATEDMYFNDIWTMTGDIRIEHSANPKIFVSLASVPYTTEDGSGTSLYVRTKTYVHHLELDVSIINDDGTENPYAKTYENTLTITDDTWMNAQSIAIVGQDDDDTINTDLHEYKVKFTPVPKDPTDPDYDTFAQPYYALDSVYYPLFNLDNDTSNVLTDVNEFTVNESYGKSDIGIKLPVPPVTNATVTATISPVTECALYDGVNMRERWESASLTFDKDNYDTFQKIHIVGVADGIEDGDKTCTLQIAASSSDFKTPFNGKPITIEGTNQDNGINGIAASLKNSTIYEYFPSIDGRHPMSTTLNISLKTQPTSDVYITLTPKNADETDTNNHITISETTLTYTPLDYATVHQLEVSSVRDYIDTNNKLVKISITSTSADANYNDIEQILQIVVKDNDTAGLSITNPETMTLSEAKPSNSQPVEVKLTSRPTADVSLNAVSGNQSRLKVGTTEDSATASNMQTITIHPDEWDTAQTFYVFPVDDYIENTTNSVPLNFTTSSSDPKYQNITANSNAFTIRDDDYVHNIQIQCDEIGCAQYGEEIISCQYTIFESPKDLDSVTLICSGEDVPGFGTILPSESQYSVVLKKSSDWVYRKIYTDPTSSPCCGTESTYPSVMKVRTLNCVVNNDKYRANGTGYVKMEYRPGYCSWAHE